MKEGGRNTIVIHISGCKNDADCNGKDEKCDLDTNICKKQCKEKKDCKGDKQTCDASMGFCVDGEIYFQ